MIMGYRGGPLFRRNAVSVRAQGFVPLATEGAQSSVLSVRAQGFTTGRTENLEGQRSRAMAAVLRPRNDRRLGGQDHADPAGTNRTTLTIAGPDRFLLNAPWRCSAGNCAVGNGNGRDGRTMTFGRSLLIFSRIVTWTTKKTHSAVPFLLSPWPSAVLRVLRGTTCLACRHSHPPVLAGMAQTPRPAS